MSIKQKIVMVTCCVLVMTALLFLFIVDNVKEGSTGKINEEITRIEPFSLSSAHTDLLTSVEGTVFYRSSAGKPASAQIIASIHIDPHDWGGVSFNLPDNWQISEVKSSYPEGNLSEDPSSLVTILTTHDVEVQWRNIIEIAKNSISAAKHAGGYGTVVIDLTHTNEKSQNPLNFSVSIGSKMDEGIKMVGTDVVEINLE